MAADETSICNLALALLGQSAIMSLDDASQAARFCKRLYGQTRDEVLQAHRWNFAIRQKRLAQLAEMPEGAWAKAYQLPTDCLRVLALNDTGSGTGALWEVDGRHLLTDEVEALVRYVSRMTDANYFPPLFVEALSVKLGARLAQPLTGSRTTAGDLIAEYERVTGPRARRVDAFEGRPKRRQPWEESDLVRARY